MSSAGAGAKILKSVADMRRARSVILGKQAIDDDSNPDRAQMLGHLALEFLGLQAPSTFAAFHLEVGAIPLRAWRQRSPATPEAARPASAGLVAIVVDRLLAQNDGDRASPRRQRI